MAKFLIVDDSIFVRERLKSILEKHQHEVIEAENGASSIELFKENAPDMVIMDITMPEMNGITATKEILKIDENAQIMMLTNVGEQSIVLEALQTGAVDYITKPFDEEKLISRIKLAMIN